ncbi:MAG: hypothetical protein AAF404_16045, partial [Pseudomonadota bacterium]
MKSFVHRLLSWWVKPTVIPSEPARLFSESNTEHPILYVFEHNSLTDYAALKIVCRQHHLPDPDRNFTLDHIRYSSSTDVLKRRRRRLLYKS